MSVRTILHTIETAGPGGAETVFLNLATRLDPKRFRSLVLLPEGRWLPHRLRDRGVPVIIAESKGWYDFSLLREMAGLVRHERVDLIHSHLPDQNFYSCLVGELTRCKTIVTFHGAPGAAYDGGTKQALKAWTVRHSADAVVVVSEYLRGIFRATGFPGNKITRIYNGVCMSQFSAARTGRLRAELACGPESKLVGMVANLRRSKGYEYFVRAARKIADALPDTRFVAIGEANPAITARTSNLLQELGLQHQFTFLGFREDVGAILSDLDVYVLSSVSEGLSIATIEAMASSRPVVVTRSGGPQEIVEEGRTGFLVPPADPGALAARVCELLQNPQLAATLGRNARQEVEGRFSLETMIEEYQLLYERTLSNR